MIDSIDITLGKLRKLPQLDHSISVLPQKDN